jgi:hypothetical protein
MGTEIWGTVQLAIAIAALCVTLTTGKILRRPREWLRSKSPSLGALLSCAYCTCHWVAAAVLLARGWSGAGDFVRSLFFLVGLSSVWIGLITRLIPFSKDAPSLQEPKEKRREEHERDDESAEDLLAVHGGSYARGPRTILGRRSP